MSAERSGARPGIFRRVQAWWAELRIQLSDGEGYLGNQPDLSSKPRPGTTPAPRLDKYRIDLPRSPRNLNAGGDIPPAA